MTYRAWNRKPLDRAALRELTQAIAEQAAEELEYNAQDDEPWSEQKYAAALAAQQKENALLAGVLTARGITDPTEALTLLAGEEELSDPSLLTDMDKACERIWQAIDEGETIVVFGDYDVDGVTATALLYQHLKGMGATVKCMLPSREGDGYGLSRNAIRSIHDKGCKLIVTVDNGISAVEEADYAAELGIDLIITDHHLPPETLPKAIAVVDPRREDDTSPFKGLCGAGVAFKLCAALDGCPPEEMLDYCGDLAAVGTVADVMPLTGENRTLVKAGLRQLQNTDRPGLEALLEEVGLAGRPVTAENVSYAIAPRINAAGRMDSAVTALQLVMCEDPDRAAELAHKLNEINAKRQETELQIFKAAQELLEQKQIPEPYHGILLKLADMFENIESLEDAKALVKNDRSLQAIARLEKLKERLEQYGVVEYISFDLGMLSKYQYYTGVVFKAYTYGIGDAVVKGGRYDNLLKRFGKDAAAIGFVIVIDDLLEALSRQKVAITLPASGKVLYYRAGDEADYLAKLAEATSLRKEGISTVLSPETIESEEADQ